VRGCTSCGGELEQEFRFCPWCAAPQRRKLVELFPAAARIEGDAPLGLRVSRYLDEGHVRFSVWDGERVQAAVSVEDVELARLRRLLAPPAATRRARGRSFVERAATRVGLFQP
jgi:hypothetical protein